MADSPFTFRLGTQDVETVRKVIFENEYSLEDKFDEKDLIIDVGANIGCFVAKCVDLGAAKIRCYEPDYDNFLILSKNIQGMNRKFQIDIKPENIALWKKGTRYIEICSGENFTACHSVVYGKPTGCTVPTMTLDEIVGHDNVRLLKIDCEGGEWPGLYEFTKWNQVKEMLIEVHKTIPVQGYDCDPMSVFKLISQNGFVVGIRKNGEGDTNYMVHGVRV